MPALVLFNRRWLLASDDVPLPAAACALFHAVWCILLIVWFASVHGPRDCEGAWRYDVAVGGLLGAFVLSCGVEAAMVRHGLRGGPFETRRRRLIPRLIYIDFVSHLAQVAFNGYGTWLLYNAARPVCAGGASWDPFDAMLALVWSSWAFIASLLLLLVLTYNLFPDYSDPRSWERRCNCIGTLCCCCHRRDQLYNDAAGQPQRITSRLGNIFATLFSHIDLSATDVLLAFTLAMALQRIQRKQHKAVAAQQDGGKGGRAGPPRQSYAVGSAPLPGVQLSPQHSPAAASSVCSADDLLVSDAEGGLLGASRKRLLRQPASSSGGAVAGVANGRTTAVEPTLDELRRTSQFGLAHPQQGARLQLGAEKLQAGEEGGGDGGWPGRHAAGHGGDLGAVDSATLQEAAWAMKFAFAAYGYLLFLFSEPTLGCVQLLFGRNCGLLVGTANGRRVRKKLDLHLVHNLNREATQQAAGLADADLLDVRYEGEVPHVLPYFLAVDHPSRRLVLAIRGSLSLDDVVRDLLFEPACLDQWAEGGRAWEEEPPPLRPATAQTRFAAHAGILEAARATFTDLQQQGVLRDALLAPGAPCAGYRLVVTGHSLGAGCAFLLAVYLRHFCPELRCWAFSPPGGLASAELCSAAADWCTSVVCGKEWIPRLSVRTFQRMRDEMVFAALRCKRPKWVVLVGLLAGKRWTEEELFYGPDELPMEAREALRRYHDSVERTLHARSFIRLAEDFQPPGRCFQLRPTGVSSRTGGWCRRTKLRQYRATYVTGQAIIDQGILIGGRMMADHMPDYCLATLRRLAQSLRHSRSTANVSDAAGHRLTDELMEHGEGDGSSEDAGSDDDATPQGRSPLGRRRGPGGGDASVPPPPQRPPQRRL